MGTTYDISVDPGVNATGVCIWENGKVKDDKPITLRPSSGTDDYVRKGLDIARQFSDLCMGLLSFECEIDRIAIEEFVITYAAKGQDTLNRTAMVRCGTVRGMLLKTADDFAKSAFVQSKGTVKKEDTAILAQGYGLRKCSKDALDAFQIGVCAGFDRKRP